MSRQLLVAMSHVEKAFAGVKVLRDGSIDIRAGEIHALMGANGAGKSTLMKILVGVYSPDGGSVAIANPGGDLSEVAGLTPRTATDHGIAIVHQELVLLDELTVAENLSLGREPRNRWGLIRDREAEVLARDALMRVGLGDVSPRARVGGLSTAKKQLVEIARALSSGARVIILDEPTTALSTSEANQLMDILRALRDEGVAVVYISHRMDEIFSLTDTITVMRDGAYVATVATADVTRDELVRLMIGRELQAYTARQTHSVAPTFDGECALQVDALTSTALHGVSLGVHRGEIVGIFGLVGAGRTELARAVFGVDGYASGSVTVNGQPLTPRSPARATAVGIGFVPKERKASALVLGLSNIRNLELAMLPRVSVFKRTAKDDTELWQTYSEALGIVARGPHQETGRLSGGNQQKIVLAKWLAVNPSVLILDEPTKGVDVAAKQDIYEQIRMLADQGVAIVVISSESEEIRMLSDRVIVMREGAITHEGPNQNLDDEALLRHAMGASA